MRIKRALNASQFKKLCKSSLHGPFIREGEVEAIGKEDLRPYLDLLFEPRIWSGKTALSRNWISRRLQDAKGAIFPRDLICLLQERIHGERERLSEPRRTSDTSVISREALSNAWAQLRSNGCKRFVKNTQNSAYCWTLLPASAVKGFWRSLRLICRGNQLPFPRRKPSTS